MTNQTIEQAVQEFKAKQTLVEPDGFLADVGEDYEAVDFNMEVVELWLREALQAQRDAGAEEERERILKLMYTVDVNKVPTIAEEAWANQFDHKAEAFWRGQAQYRKELEEEIINPTY